MRPPARKFALVALTVAGLGALAVGIAPSALPVAGSVLGRTALMASSWAASTARADEMKFTPLPAESASSLEGSRSRRRSAVPSVPSIPPAPVPPPPTPPVPTVVIGKSGDIMRVGSDITVARDEVVTGDVLAVGGDLRVEGHIEGNAVAMGGEIYLEPTARVDGDVVCMGGELHEEPGATVGGKRVVGLGGRGARLSRQLRGHDIDVEPLVHGAVRDRIHHLGGTMGWLMVWLLIAWVTVKLAPGRTGAAVDELRRAPGAAFLVGWLAIVLTMPGLIAVALLTALLCITIIGIPLGIALLFAYFLFLGVFAVWGGVVGAAGVGGRVAQRAGSVSPTLMRAALYGILVLDGAMVVAEMMKWMGFIPFFLGFGRFFKVLLIIANVLVGVTGWGALLRSEFTTGWIARWWHGRRSPGGGGPAPAPAGPVPPPTAPGGPGATIVTTVPSAGAAGIVAPPPIAPTAATPPPPAPPESYMPPPYGSPGGGPPSPTP